MKKLYSSIIFILLSLCFVVGSCFSPLDHYNGHDNGGGSISVILPSIQFVSGTSGSRVSAFSGDPYTLDDLDYTVTFTNTATNKVVEAEATKSDDSVSARAVITPGHWRIDVEAKFSAIARAPGVPGETYALAYETIDIQKNETIDIQMKRVIKVVFISNGITVDTQFVIEDGKISRPNDPTHDGYIYIFKGWHTKDGTLDGVWDDEWFFTNTVPSLISHYELYAKWEEIYQDGTEAHPYLVYSPETLAGVGTNTGDYTGWLLTSHYKQIADINVSGQEWVRIGSGTGVNAFSGSYDGQNHTITSLTITNATTQYQGMFGYIDGGTIKNLNLVNCDITVPQGTVGGIAGYITAGSTVDFCYVSGNVNSTSTTQTNEYTGGMVGENRGTVKYCVSDANVSGIRAGGLVGQNGNNTGTIQNCFARGNVTGSITAGGLLTGNYYYGRITDCYATGNVVLTGNTYANNSTGGLVGVNDQSSTITNCYATGNVTGTNASGYYGTGGLLGWMQNSSPMRNSVALNAFVTGVTANNGRVVGLMSTSNSTNNYARSDMFVNSVTVTTGTGLTTVQGADVAVDNTLSMNTLFVTNAQWGADVWNIPSGNLRVGGPLPTLKNMPGPKQNSTLPAAVGYFDSGIGTESDPYIIKTAAQLAKLAEVVNAGNANFRSAYYKFGNDINLSGYNAANTSFNSGKGWIPIGTQTNPFRGHFDGNFRKVSGLYVNDSTLAYAGLFGFFIAGTLKNLGVEGTVVAGTNVGGLVGYVGSSGNPGSVINCHANVAVSGLTHVGGLVGINSNNSTITNSYATGNVTGTGNGTNDCYGGLVGANSNSIITNCYATGNVTGTLTGLYNCAGGLVGGNDYSNGRIENSYATGNVTGTGSMGGVSGLVGYNSNGATILNSAALNEAVSGPPNTNRIVGYFGSSTLANNHALEYMSVSRNDSPVTVTPNINGVEGADIDAASLKTQTFYTTGTNWYNNQGWAFGNDDDNPWKMGNSSYPLPVLYWQAASSYPTLPAHLNE